MANTLETDMVAQHEIPARKSLSPWQTFLSYIWDTDQHLKSPFERHLLRKVSLIVSSLRPDLNEIGTESDDATLPSPGSLSSTRESSQSLAWVFSCVI